ncbi:MAG: cation diffusion facilitator family transporter [Lachnospiraceae bacterium]
MTDFIIKKFVKDSENIRDDKVRGRYGIVAGAVGLSCNLLLFLIKLIVGMVIQSIAVTADAFNNLSDAGASVVTLISARLASKPADKDHPFGHGRIEYIAAFIVAFLIMQVGFSFLKSSIDKIRNPEELKFQWIPFCLLLVSILVKLWMVFFNRRIGQKIESKILLATSADSLGDVVITASTVLAILISHLLNFNIDAYAGVVISLLVMWAGIGIARDTLKPLIGESIDPVLYQQIKSLVEAYPGIEGTHDLIVHNYGPNRNMASIHAEVPCDVNIEQAHELIDQIEREVSKKADVLLVIHMDPIEIHNENILRTKQMAEDAIHEIDVQLSIHDFRMVNGGNHINLIFDVVVPHKYTQDEEDTISLRIMEKIKEINPHYECVITVDRSFLAEEN